jgi:hypothetical protein
MSQPSERLRKVLEVGSVLDLFPVLKDWSTYELQALLKDVDSFAAAQYAAIDEAWKKAVFRQEVFLNSKASKFVDRAKDESKIRVMTAMSEICSVAIFYLQERGVATE